METSLVDQAKQLASIKNQQKQSKYTEQDVDLVLAFLQGEIAMKALLSVKNMTQYVSGMTFITNVLKFGVQNTLITIERK
jgi:hypothetical protein